MKLQTQFTVPKRELKDLNYFKKVDFLKVNNFLILFINFIKRDQHYGIKILPN